MSHSWLLVAGVVTRVNRRNHIKQHESLNRWTGCIDYKIAVIWPHRSRRINKKGSQYLITERRVPELIPVLGSQPAGDVSHKPGGRLPLLSARPAVTPATLKRAATSFAAW